MCSVGGFGVSESASSGRGRHRFGHHTDVPASTVPASSRALREAFPGGWLPVEVPPSSPGLASTQRDPSEDDVPLSSVGRTRQRSLEATQWDSGAEFTLTRASGLTPTADVLPPVNPSATGIPPGVTVHVKSGADEREESDTESCQWEDRQERRRRRLRLTWNPTGASRAGSSVHREVRTASHLIRNLARRIGVVARGQVLPRARREQRWSPLNVPLMLAAVGEKGVTP